MGKKTVTVITCDRCNAEIKDVYDSNEFSLLRSTKLNILSIYVPSWDRTDEHYLCKDCFKKLKEFLDERK